MRYPSKMVQGLCVAIGVAGLVTFLQTGQGDETSQSKSTNGTPATFETHLQLRKQLDRTVWKTEVDAQYYETPIILLWDRLRSQSNRFDVLKSFVFRRLTLPRPTTGRLLDGSVREVLLNGQQRSLDHAQWISILDWAESSEYEIVQSEWHHAEFLPDNEDMPATSVVNFAIDVKRQNPVRFASIRGELHIRWTPLTDDGATPVADTINAKNVKILMRDALPAFRVVHSVTATNSKRLMPLVVYDLDRNGFCDVLLGGMNRIYFNRGQGQFDVEPIAPGLDIFDTGVVADFTGDGLADFVCVGADRRVSLCVGKTDGRFYPPRRCANMFLELPKSMTAGDMDADGDLDIWIGQYKFLYADGAMPTPFYDANDGPPSYLLINDGNGHFVDVTEKSGLDAKRHRRTYSSSFVDLDDDGDLDLMTVNDFAGVDVYANDGRGQFAHATDQWLSDRHLFGMGHTLSDFNFDGQLDMYLIGMSSTTARRLEQLQLGRDDHDDINRMRKVMGYGNRMLLRSDKHDQPMYVQAPFNDHVARTGWSWGTSSFDFDRDGDRDIYVANGHNSGQSSRDYCTRFWCHDVYTGTSQTNQELVKLFRQSLRELRLGEISWNGFEHNVLQMNLGGEDFVNVGYLMGVGFEFDSRGVVSEDLDADGRPDLLVVQYNAEGTNDPVYTLHFVQNQMPSDNHWIGVRLYESTDGPSPIGARITVNSAAGRQVHRIVTGDSFSSQHSTFAHFGLGTTDQLESIEVRWIDGSKTHISTPAMERYHTISWSGKRGE